MNSDEARKISEENTNSDQVSKYLRGIYLTIQTQAELGKTNCLQTCPAKLFPDIQSQLLMSGYTVKDAQNDIGKTKYFSIYWNKQPLNKPPIIMRKGLLPVEKSVITKRTFDEYDVFYRYNETQYVLCTGWIEFETIGHFQSWYLETKVTQKI